MDPLELIALTRSLIDIDSTSGKEAEASHLVADWLRKKGFNVVEQPVIEDRFNIIATLDEPEIILSTHIDCVPPFFPSREENGIIYGRGACDAKGILATQLAALENIKDAGERRVGILIVVGEERGSQGAHTANTLNVKSKYLINGEPTDNRLGAATRGVYRVRLVATGRAAHSSHPELGESAIEKLLEALQILRSLKFPSDAVLGETHYTVGLISGGVAPNVVPPIAEADINFRTVRNANSVRAALNPLLDFVKLVDVVEVPPVVLETVSGFETEVFPFTTDIPFLSKWGKPLLLGPGSVLVAHTDNEHIKITELTQAVTLYEKLINQLLLNV
tara:strand:+ start:372 stop:1373 length:1002 start_codon:yes stop_codon:yes gene_type:complete